MGDKHELVSGHEAQRSSFGMAEHHQRGGERKDTSASHKKQPTPGSGYQKPAHHSNSGMGGKAHKLGCK